jgi:excisionase family DNA binding protein
MPERAKPSAEVKFITRKRAAEIAACDVQSIDKMIRNGNVPAYRVGRKVILKLDDLLFALQQNRVEVRP